MIADENVKVGDLWLIALDEKDAFNTYAKMKIIAFTTNTNMPVGEYIDFVGMHGQTKTITWPNKFLKLLERDGEKLAEDPDHDYEKWKSDLELGKYLEGS